MAAECVGDKASLSCLNDTFAAFAFTVFAFALACAASSAFVHDDLLCTWLLERTHVAAHLCHFVQCLVQRPSFAVHCSEL